MKLLTGVTEYDQLRAGPTRALGNAGQADGRFASIAAWPKQTILMAINTNRRGSKIRNIADDKSQTQRPSAKLIRPMGNKQAHKRLRTV
jgi:hypothetical protein